MIPSTNGISKFITGLGMLAVFEHGLINTTKKDEPPGHFNVNETEEQQLSFFTRVLLVFCAVGTCCGWKNVLAFIRIFWNYKNVMLLPWIFPVFWQWSGVAWEPAVNTVSWVIDLILPNSLRVYCLTLTTLILSLIICYLRDLLIEWDLISIRNEDSVHGMLLGVFRWAGYEIEKKPKSPSVKAIEPKPVDETQKAKDDCKALFDDAFEEIFVVHPTNSGAYETIKKALVAVAKKKKPLKQVTILLTPGTHILDSLDDLLGCLELELQFLSTSPPMDTPLPGYTTSDKAATVVLPKQTFPIFGAFEIVFKNLIIKLRGSIEIVGKIKENTIQNDMSITFKSCLIETNGTDLKKDFTLCDRIRKEPDSNISRHNILLHKAGRLNFENCRIMDAVINARLKSSLKMNTSYVIGSFVKASGESVVDITKCHLSGTTSFTEVSKGSSLTIKESEFCGFSSLLHVRGTNTTANVANSEFENCNNILVLGTNASATFLTNVFRSCLSFAKIYEKASLTLQSNNGAFSVPAPLLVDNLSIAPVMKSQDKLVSAKLDTSDLYKIPKRCGRTEYTKSFLEDPNFHGSYHNMLKYCGNCDLIEGVLVAAEIRTYNMIPETEETHDKFHYCGKCKKVCYCSNFCQSLDWGDHKTACRFLKALD